MQILNMLLLFTLNLVKTLSQTSKWQSHLISYLHLDTLRVHNSLSANYKNSNNQQGARQRHPR